jgi:uncharacterized protein (DUF1501 family)
MKPTPSKVRMSAGEMSRRRFLQWSGVAAAGALAAGATHVTLADVAAAARQRPLPLGTPILVVVTLYGGNDGLSTVVPYQDAAYAAARPGIAFSSQEVLPIGEGLGLNASMTGFKRLWDAGRLAVVRGVGYPRPDHSHFSSMAIWQSGSPGSARPTGWLGRWLDTAGDDPMLAINIGSTMPPLLAGATRAGSALPVGGLRLPTGSLADQCQLLAGVASAQAREAFASRWTAGNITSRGKWTASWRRLNRRRRSESGSAYAARAAAAYARYLAERAQARQRAVELWTRANTGRSGTALQERAAESLADMFTIGTTVGDALAADPAAVPELPTAGGGNAGGDDELSQQLDVVAKLIGGNAPTRVWSVSLGGFDTHADERSAQSRLIGHVSSAVEGFLARLAGTGRAEDVTVLVYSEFGRRVRANASDGTDHGTAGPVFVAGPKVRGGFYGEQPSLTALDAGDLFVTTDFRDVYATLLEGVLATPADRILGQWRGRTPLLRS